MEIIGIILLIICGFILFGVFGWILKGITIIVGFLFDGCLTTIGWIIGLFLLICLIGTMI